MEWWQILILMTMGGIFLVDAVNSVCRSCVTVAKYKYGKKSVPPEEKEE